MKKTNRDIGLSDYSEKRYERPEATASDSSTTTAIDSSITVRQWQKQQQKESMKQ